MKIGLKLVPHQTIAHRLKNFKIGEKIGEKISEKIDEKIVILRNHSKVNDLGVTQPDYQGE